MKTECNADQLEFHGLGRREVVGQFNGGNISSDGGGLLLRETEQRTHLVKQRVYGLALGYEDLNDHDSLQQDHLLALMSDKSDLKGQGRRREQDQGKALAGKSTLNRLELTPAEANKQSRYKKIVADPVAMDQLLVDLFIESYQTPPTEIVLDVDATDDPLHGNQEGRFFHGYYRCYCYLPLYIFCGEQLLCARLRTANQDAAAGTVEELARLVSQLRLAWPEVRIILRGDSGFCRDDIMNWCEAHQVDYVLGCAKNNRLKTLLEAEMAQGESSRIFVIRPAKVGPVKDAWWVKPSI